MAFGKSNGKQGAADGDSVILEPQDAFDAAIESIGAWLAELRVRREVFDTAAAGLRRAGKYPQMDLAGLFEMCERVETGLIHQRPELFGGIAPESKERVNVRQARSDVATAQETLEKYRRLLGQVDRNTEPNSHRQLMTIVQDWALALKQRRVALAEALERCDDLSKAERSEIGELRAGAEERITIEL